MSNKRKPLNDTLAEQFVYGEPKITQPEIAGPQSLELEPQNQPGVAKKPTFMEKLHQEPKEATVRLTVDLPKSMHQRLSILAATTGQKKATIIRVLLEEKLDELQEN